MKQKWDIKKLLYKDSILYKVGSPQKDVEKGLKKLGWKFQDVLANESMETNFIVKKA